MIARIWHGWTTPENSDTYKSLLRKEIFVGIKRREIKGLYALFPYTDVKQEKNQLSIYAGKRFSIIYRNTTSSQMKYL